MKLNKKHLPFYSAFVQTIQYGLAGYLLLSWVGMITLGTMGALISLAVAYAASQISDIAKGRKLAGWVAMAGLMLFSPIIIGTATYYHLDVVTNATWRIIVAGAWGILPDGAVALSGFIAGKGMVEQTEKQKKQPKATGKAKPIAQEIAPVAFMCATCGYEAKSQKALNGHQLKHKPIAYAVSLIEPVTKEVKP